MILRKFSIVLFFALSILLNSDKFAESEEGAAAAPVFTYKIVNTYPHDRQAFTQGLVFEEGVLYEGTGLNGQSSLRKVKLETGEPLKIHKLSPDLFGEGITVYGDKIIQLTWKSRVGFVYDKDSFKLHKKFSYPTEGWGLTYDGRQLIMSDGTECLYFLDPETFKEVRRIKAHDNKGPVLRLNELEYINGEIYANIWPTDLIVKIDQETGRVTGLINLEGLSPVNDEQKRKVLNGIAYDAVSDRLFVTGKLWPVLYEIKLVPLE
ncbi:MAG: glutaminyl-peptide cyclotransferase [Nitrospirae bacterium]|nr:glutaminyl-peptide cyclotransferase [Nitrospirota bacterium]